MKSWSQIWKKVSLKDVLNYEQPNEYIISKPLKDDDSLTPVLTPNKSFIKGYTDEKNGIKHYYVYKKNNGKAEKQFIDIGLMNENEVIVKKGLSKNDNIYLSVPIEFIPKVNQKSKD